MAGTFLAALTLLAPLGRAAAQDGDAGESRIVVTPVPPAAPTAPVPRPLPPELAQLAVATRPDPYVRARRLRTAGQVLTFLGGCIGLAAMGAGIHLARQPDPHGLDEAIGQGLGTAFAASAGIIGAALLIPGVILWPVGQARMNRARKAGYGRRGAALTLTPAPAGALGGGVGLRF